MPRNYWMFLSSKRSWHLLSSERLLSTSPVLSRYVKSGMRIPRRGEVGITAEQIDGLEGLGYARNLRGSSTWWTATNSRQCVLKHHQVIKSTEADSGKVGTHLVGRLQEYFSRQLLQSDR